MQWIVARGCQETQQSPLMVWTSHKCLLVMAPIHWEHGWWPLTMAISVWSSCYTIECTAGHVVWSSRHLDAWRLSGSASFCRSQSWRRIWTLICACIILHNICEQRGHCLVRPNDRRHCVVITENEEPSAELDQWQQQEGARVRVAITRWILRRWRRWSVS